MLSAVLHGFLLTLGLILPLGIQNIFIFNQGAVNKSLVNALPSIITASICDTLLILASVLGVSMIVMEIPLLQNSIFIIGFFFLLYVSYTTWTSAGQKITTKTTPLSAKKQILFAASVSILNPPAIIDTVTVIGTHSLHYEGNIKIAFVISCVCVSWIWFISLATAGRLISRVDSNGKVMVLLNKISAIIIFCVALIIGKEIVTTIVLL
jgi:L-lysine exporter family protein LysE/ArgO